MSSATFHAWIDAFFSNPYLAWGVGPVLGVNLGYWPLAFIMEWYVRLPSSRDQHVIWRGGNGDRLKDIEKTQDEIPIRTQVFGPYGCFFVLAGPAAIIGGLLSALIFTRLLGMEHAPASAVRFSVAARQLCVMEVVGDLFLYLGHRLLHEVPYLYRHFHVHHHQIHTPTALGTACIDSVDSTIQATLPIFAAAVAARPHPLVFSCYSGLRVAAYPGETPVVSGGVPLKVKWRPYQVSPTGAPRWEVKEAHSEPRTCTRAINARATQTWS